MKNEQQQVALTALIILIGVSFCYGVSYANYSSFEGCWTVVWHYVNLWVIGSLIWAAIILLLGWTGRWTTPFELAWCVCHDHSDPGATAKWYQILYMTALLLMVIPVVVFSPLLGLAYWLFHKPQKEA